MDKQAFPLNLDPQYYECFDGCSKKDYKQLISGMTLREHAAITVRVPDSGDEQLDAMIRQANRRDAAVAAMQAILSNGEMIDSGDAAKWVADTAVSHADALLAMLEEKQ